MINFKTIVITGGAGFVGSNLATLLRTRLDSVAVTALDNLKRSGSELNVPRLKATGVNFVHGDIRCREDLEALPPFDLLIDCSAEPSVLAGSKGGPRFVLETNLLGTINCLELARAQNAAFLFLSTSRVYPIRRLNELPYDELETRFRWKQTMAHVGFSDHGIAEDFALDGPRSFYGASKLASEQLIQEYVHAYGMRALINRCGILTGPWQMGKVDQGIVTLWVARHHYGRPLRYTGFSGLGKQVRDVLHIEDLFDLLLLQMEQQQRWDGRVYNVGGGNELSVSLRELTELCSAATGQRVPIEGMPETNSVDLRLFITDARKVQHDYGWRPQRSVPDTIRDILAWVREYEGDLRNILA